jgi:hypothetical protein
VLTVDGLFGCVCVLADAAEPPSLQQQRSSVLQLCSQLQRASLLAQQQQSSAGGWGDDSLSSSGRSSSGAGSNTARTVLSLLQTNRDALDNLPKVWVECSSCVSVSSFAGLVHVLLLHVSSLAAKDCECSPLALIKLVFLRS